MAVTQASIVLVVLFWAAFRGALSQECTPAEQQLGKRLGPPSDDFCSWFNRLPTAQKCEARNLVEQAVTKAQFGRCDFTTLSAGVYGNQVEPVSVSIAGAPLPQALPDRRPLPASFPLSIATNEGATYHWLYRNAHNLARYASCSPENGGNASYLVPSGWQLEKMINLPQGNSSLSIPFAVVLTRSSPAQTVIIVRGTMNTYEWGLDFTYSQVAVPGFPGLIHKGFATALSAIWPEVQRSLRTAIARKSSIFVAGHSLGAGVSTLTAYAAQRYIDKHSNSRTVVDAVLVAPPNVGNHAFVQAFSKLVNARRVVFEYDVVPQVPCAPAMPRCNDTSAGNVTNWKYSDTTGSVLITGDVMPVQPRPWSSMTVVDICNGKYFGSATHACSYMCYTAQYVGDLKNDCLLWETTDQSEGAYCNNYPTTSYPPMVILPRPLV